MFQFIGSFFSGSWARVRLTVEQISWALGTVFILTIIGIIPALFGAPLKHSFYLSFPIWLFSAYRIFGIWRYLHVAVIGEVVDSLQAIGSETNQTIWDSQVATTYRKAAINIWLAQTIIFLAAPLYFTLTSGGRLWLPVLIMVVFAIAMISINTGLLIFRATAVITITIFLLVMGYDMFPQVGYIPFVSEGIAKLKSGKLAGENARALDKVNAIREKQRQEKVTATIAKVTTWQNANPGRELPERLKKEIEAAKLGLTVSEYENLKVSTPPPPATIGDSAPPPTTRESVGLAVPGKGGFPVQINLPPGRYRSVPATNFRFRLEDEAMGSYPHSASEDGVFSVPVGRTLGAVKVSSPTKFYRLE